MSEDQVQSDAKSQISNADSQTAQDYIVQQLQLEADAREALPYQFDACTKPLGRLRQSLFACLTCNPPTASPYVPAGVCYSCSISCHGEHELVELFSKRDFECDCGTTRIVNISQCSLRSDEKNGLKGQVIGENPNPGNKYNRNFAGKFCGCGEEYDPTKEKGTMFQCLGLGHIDTGGCGEDWWHPECLLGLQRSGKATVVTNDQPSDSVMNANSRTTADEHPLPSGFPAEDDFDHIICYKCVETNPWIKRYAGTTGFLPPVMFSSESESSEETSATVRDDVQNTKRKRDEDEDDQESKRIRHHAVNLSKTDDKPNESTESSNNTPAPRHSELPAAPSGIFSLFLKEDFRNHFCRCPTCFPQLSLHPQLLEEEDTYEPPISESNDEQGQGSVGSRSLLDRGEAALSTMDRARAIEGVMAYNHLKDKVKAFLQPFAESGQTVGAEDVKAYFARLRGDEDAIRLAASGASGAGEDGDNRREQSGY